MMDPQLLVKCRYCNKDYSRKRQELNIHGINNDTDNEVAVKPVVLLIVWLTLASSELHSFENQLDIPTAPIACLTSG
ncbi:hypothetical protein E2C01_087857 [Portunus trituberculatus]|uniref:Uncharacterized protein n=1 Tax=Portunus trituberculatus TaxID=210409 RepID=A0A5B7J4L8_PORTR|nr:hypothetical protein [Portunus trituberculatus]